MQLHSKTAQVFVPDQADPEPALARTTHLGIGAHQDDLEIMAYHGIAACLGRQDRWFTGVVVTNGSGSPRMGAYAQFTDDQMRQVRAQEQCKAAVIGEYSAQILMDYPSQAVKDRRDTQPTEDLAVLIETTRPTVVYTHNLADKHDTHIAVTLRVIDAIRMLPSEGRPSSLYGCEVWRDLDWLVDVDKVAFDCSGSEHIQAALLGVFDSQIAGGKRYDLAVMGRRHAHATYAESHSVDMRTGLTLAMDLTPLIEVTGLDPAAYVQEFVQRFADDVAQRIERLRG